MLVHALDTRAREISTPGRGSGLIHGARSIW